MKTRLSIILIAGLLTTPAAAQDDGVYESLGQIPVGRIFLSPEERARLDKMRGKAPVRSSSSAPTGDTSRRSYDKDAAGFIVSDSGKTRVWKNVNFVATSSASDVRFPGQVRVASQTAARDSDGNDEADDSAEPTVEAGDDQE